MQAVQIDKFVTTFNELSVKTVEVPTPGPGQAVVRVVAAGINPVDKILVTGIAAGMGWGMNFPYVPGEDYSGVVHAVGDGVTNVSIGDDVFACNWGKTRHDDLVDHPTNGGAFAEYALVTASKLSKKPKNVSFEEAAAIGIPGTTAYECLLKIGKLEAGQKVLVLGASSAVGIFAVQIAKLSGAIVTATCSTRSNAFVQSINSIDSVINYDQTPWDEALRGQGDFDIVFDTVGDKNGLQRALDQNILKEGTGKFVSIAEFSIGFDPTSKQPRLEYAAAMCLSQDTDAQDQIAQWISNGDLKVIIDERFPFTSEGVVALFEKVAGGKSLGKNILSISS